MFFIGIQTDFKRPEISSGLETGGLIDVEVQTIHVDTNEKDVQAIKLFDQATQTDSVDDQHKMINTDNNDNKPMDFQNQLSSTEEGSKQFKGTEYRNIYLKDVDVAVTVGIDVKADEYFRDAFVNQNLLI